MWSKFFHVILFNPCSEVAEYVGSGQVKIIAPFLLIFVLQRLSLDGIPEGLGKIIAACWTHEPSGRPNFVDISKMLEQEFQQL